ncbi:hypothetical protein LZ30DRAFT_29780 [Colletotrichum cereale]|nr:hypothetical protein LZ30DRAFT_29780 [Colletotrichum cereale]
MGGGGAVCFGRMTVGPLFLFVLHQAVGCTVQVFGGSGPSAVASPRNKGGDWSDSRGFASGKKTKWFGSGAVWYSIGRARDGRAETGWLTGWLALAWTDGKCV